MTGKNVKDRMGPGGMDADRIREIMGEAPACPRKGRGTSGNDIMRPARKSGPMQPSVYGEDFSKPKIIWGEISDKSKFAFDFLGEYIPEATSFYMKGECIEYLLSALNSSVSEWLFSKVGTTTGVGTIRWKKYTIEQLIVAKLSTEQLNTHLAAFNDLKVGKMSITDFECFSNKLMYDVYKLTSDEIQYIENQQIV